MRLFTAIDIPADLTEALRSFVNRLRPTAKIGWSPVENLHVTTKFIGDWPERVRGGLVVVVHPQMPSMPPGMPWNASLSRLRART